MSTDTVSEHGHDQPAALVALPRSTAAPPVMLQYDTQLLSPFVTQPEHWQWPLSNASVASAQRTVNVENPLFHVPAPVDPEPAFAPQPEPLRA